MSQRSPDNRYDPAYQIVSYAADAPKDCDGDYVERTRLPSGGFRLAVWTCQDARPLYREFTFDEKAVLTYASEKASPLDQGREGATMVVKAFAREPDGRLVRVGGQGVTATPEEERALRDETEQYLARLSLNRLASGASGKQSTAP